MHTFQSCLCWFWKSPSVSIVVVRTWQCCCPRLRPVRSGTLGHLVTYHSVNMPVTSLFSYIHVLVVSFHVRGCGRGEAGLRRSACCPLWAASHDTQPAPWRLCQASVLIPMPAATLSWLPTTQGTCAPHFPEARTLRRSVSYLLVTSSCFPVMAFLEGCFGPFRLALSPVGPASFSHSLAQVLQWDLAEGCMPTGSVGAPGPARPSLISSCRS